jgi:hypothetical protein
MAQRRMPNGIDLHQTFAKALIAAHQAKALSEAIRLPDSEEVFTATLLHSLGEFALASYLPDAYAEIESRCQEGLPYDAAVEIVLGATVDELTECVMDACRLPSEMITTVPDWDRSEGWSRRERKGALVTLAGEFTLNLLGPQGVERAAAFEGLVTKAEKALKVPRERLQDVITESFQKSCSLGKALGFQPETFRPRAAARVSSNDLVSPHGRDAVLSQCLAGTHVEGESISPPQCAAIAPPSTSSALLVSFLSDLTRHVMGTPDFNTVMVCVLEGLQRAVGFDHAVLTLLVSGKPMAAGRYAVGPGAAELLPRFAISTDPTKNLLACCMAAQTPLRLNSADTPPLPLPPAIIEAVRPASVALGPLHVGKRSIGLVWADRSSGIIADDMWQQFQLFLAQANLALLRLSMSNGH